MHNRDQKYINRLLRRAEVKARTGLSVSQLYRLMEQGRFPRAVKLAERAVAWVETEVDDWVAERVQARDQQPDTEAVKPKRKATIRGEDRHA